MCQQKRTGYTGNVTMSFTRLPYSNNYKHLETITVPRLVNIMDVHSVGTQFKKHTMKKYVGRDIASCYHYRIHPDCDDVEKTFDSKVWRYQARIRKMVSTVMKSVIHY